MKRKSSLHRNNHYDSNGKLGSTLLIQKQQKTLDKIRKLITKIDIELMEEEPDQLLIDKCVVKVIDQIRKVMK